MIALLVSSSVAFAIAITTTPLAMRRLRRANIGQFIQEEVEGHMHKQGTPTMGGLVFLGAAIVGYLVAHVRVFSPEGFDFSIRPFTIYGWLVVGATVGMGAIGFADDLSKVTRARNLGLNKRWKFAGQLAVAGLFALGAYAADVSTDLSFTRSVGIDLGPVYFAWVLLLLVATANAVNLADGLDGLAAGSGSLVFGAFVIISFWQFRNPEFYEVAGALDLAMWAGSMLGATLGFLWWNAAPAKIIMGDTGANAIGGALAALALLTNTHLLLAILGGLYVWETGSVILQVISFRVWGKRVLRMAPIHHHFELAGWPETMVIIRFWIIAGLCVAVGLGIFYGDFITANGGL